MIFVISFIEAFCGGLLSINTVLYLTKILGFTQPQVGTFLTIFSIIGAVLILSFGWCIDKVGPRKTMLMGSVLLIASRLILFGTKSIPFAMAAFVIGALGGAIKSSSVLVYIRNQGKSFKLDYVVFNLAYFFSGIAYDMIKDYQLVYLISGCVNLINLFIIYKLPDIRAKLNNPTQSTTVGVDNKLFDSKVLKKVILYNMIMMPVGFIFSFMYTVFPQWVIAVLGKDAPVGKLYGSLNPFIILFMVPLYTWLSGRYRMHAYANVVIGTSISAFSLLVLCMPGLSWYTLAILMVVLFTIGEAIFSPNNMEVGTKLCPPGSEGRYLTLSLLPRTAGNMFMGWFSAYSVGHWVQGAVPNYTMPFIVMGGIALLTPICLVLFRRSMTNVDTT